MTNQYHHHLNEDSNFLINRLKTGEEAAYELLFKEYYTLLVAFANKYLHDLEDSKEMVQDLFVNLYEKREHLEINSSLKSYLFRSVHNRSLNLINSQKIRDKYAAHINLTTDIKENRLEEEVNKTELEHALYIAIGELPPKCKEIFKLNRFEGFSNAEIAERLKLSKRTVETQISKALKILRTKLQPLTSVSLGILCLLLVRLMAF
jgi:RNA polymerase sigma-70 factor (ECF subfamily)